MRMVIVVICLLNAVIHIKVNAKTKVRIGLFNSLCKPDNEPFYLARSMGWFQKEGIDIENTNKDPRTFFRKKNHKNLGNYANGDLYSSKFDVIVSGRARLYAIESNTPQRFKPFVANVQTTVNPAYAFLVNKKSHLKNIQEFTKGTILLDNNSGRAKRKLIAQILEKLKINIKLIKIQISSIVDYNNHSNYDLLYVREPQLSILLKSGKYRILDDGPVSKYIFSPWVMGFASMSQSFLNKKPSVAKKIVKIWNRAINYKRTHKKKSRHILNKCGKINYNLEQLNIRSFIFWKKNEFNLNNIQKQINLYFKLGLISRKVSVKELLK